MVQYPDYGDKLDPLSFFSGHMIKRKIALLLLLCWLLPALACNLPVTPRATTTRQSLERTLAALQTQNPTPYPRQTPVSSIPGAETITPAPGAPPMQMPTIIPGGSGHGVLIPGAPVMVDGNFQYAAQPGDTVNGLSGRFGVPLEQMVYPMDKSPKALLPIGQVLSIPNMLGEIRYPNALMPDSEILYSPSSVDLDIDAYVQQAGGFLSTYSEKVDQQTLTGAQIVRRVAQEMSVNPRLLLGVLEYRSHWVFGQPANPNQTSQPIGFYANGYSGLYKELILVGRQLTLGYYGWRSGSGVELAFLDGRKLRLSPTVNAGTEAIAYLFSKLYQQPEWEQQLYAPGKFIAFYRDQFGDPWQRAAIVEPLIPDGLAQPPLELPFLPGETWSFTGGPHIAWGVGSPLGALDFAPSTGQKGCGVSSAWATAVAPGVIIRSDHAVVIEDLDGDGYEQTGWVIMYLHVAEKERIAAGTQVNTDDRIGHPSCEGGNATGMHVHIVRKYNGEWLGADSPIPFVLSGWQIEAGTAQYLGVLTRDGQSVNARSDGSHTSRIIR